MIKKKFFLPGMILCLLLFNSITVLAASGEVHFGSEEYEHETGEHFYIGVYLESEEVIDQAEVVLRYNPRFLSYVGGGTEGGEGIVRIEEHIQSRAVRYMLEFSSQAGGNTSIAIESVHMYSADGEELETELLPEAPVYLLPDENALLTSLSINQESWNGFDGKAMTQKFTLPYSEKIDFSSEDTLKLEASAESLLPGENTVYLTVSHENGGKNVYTFHITVEEPEEELMEPEANEDESEISIDPATQNSAMERLNRQESVSGKTSRTSLEIVLTAGFLAAIVILIVTAMLLRKRRKHCCAKEAELQIGKENSDFVLLYEEDKKG